MSPFIWCLKAYQPYCLFHPALLGAGPMGHPSGTSGYRLSAVLPCIGCQWLPEYHILHWLSYSTPNIIYEIQKSFSWHYGRGWQEWTLLSLLQWLLPAAKKAFAVLEIKAKQDLGSPSAGNFSGEIYLDRPFWGRKRQKSKLRSLEQSPVVLLILVVKEGKGGETSLHTSDYSRATVAWGERSESLNSSQALCRQTDWRQLCASHIATTYFWKV